MSKKVISLVFINNTTSVQSLQISNVPTVFSGINANTQYRWNITTQNLNDLTIVELTYVLNGQTTTVSANILSESVQGIIDALNSLNIGRFWSTTSGGSTFINTYNDFVTYTNLVISNAHNIEIAATVIIGSFLSFNMTLVAPNQIFVDWGDGTVQEFNVNNPNPSHTYTTAGTYNILITIVTPTSLISFATDAVLMPEITSFSFIGNVFTVLQTLQFAQTSITSFDSGMISNSNALITLFIQGNQIASFDFISLPANIQSFSLTQNNVSILSNIASIPASITLFAVVNNKITIADVNSILIKLDTSGLFNGNVQTLGQTPAAPPSGAGITAANNLIGKGWTVITD